MKICVVVNKFVRGAGISEYLFGLLKEMKKKHDITLLAPEININVPYTKKVEFSTNINGIKFFLPYKTGNLPKFDVVISNYPTITAVKTGVKISKKQGIPHIIIDYGVAEPKQFRGMELRTRIAHWVGLKSMKASYSSADMVLPISNFLKKVYIDPLGIKSHVIMGGIDFKEFQKKYDVGAMKKLKLKKDDFALFVGRASRHKGVHLVAQAFKKIGYPVKFLAVVGEPVGAYAEELRELSDKNFIIHKEIIPREIRNELYQNCMFYVSGSLWEGLNLGLLEAQACGKPVVAFEIGAHPEVVVNGKTGFLVKEGDINALAEAMEKLIKNPGLREKMGKEAKEWAKKFDWPAIAKKVEKELKAVVS